MKARTGFTLVELMVALVLGSLTVLLTHQVFTAVSDGIRRMAAAQTDWEAKQFAGRWLDDAILSLETGSGGGGFDGHADRLEFSTWLMTEQGWPERQRVSLSLNHHRLVARAAGSSVELFPELRSVAFDYLLDPGLNSHWVSDWSSPVSAPLGVRLRLERIQPHHTDTLLFLVKGRG